MQARVGERAEAEGLDGIGEKVRGGAVDVFEAVWEKVLLVRFG